MAETKTQPALKKTAVPKATATNKLTLAVKTPRAKKPTTAISDQNRYEMIRYAAYFIAERHNFVGDPHAFWTEAEAQISNL